MHIFLDNASVLILYFAVLVFVVESVCQSVFYMHFETWAMNTSSRRVIITS